MKRLFLLLALCGMVAVGCTEGGENEIPDDAYITLNKEVLTFVPDGESVEVKVYSNYEWTLTNNCDWVTASISGGEASEEGTAITLTANLTYDNREGTIIFNCGKANKVLVVSQGLKEVIIADENNTFNLPVEGGTVDIAYQTTVECEVVIPSDAQHWISLAPETRGLESGCATLNIAENNTGTELSTVVKVVKMGDQSVFAEYTITQERNMDYIIFYTTTNGETISPNNFDYLTNTYEDGVGMLAFDGSKVTSIGERAFYNCTSLTSITIPDSVTSIGDYAFRNCESLTSVTIADSVTSIGDEAFCRCTSLTSITIPDSVTSIGSRAFLGCTSLTSITIPDSVTSIGLRAFEACTSLTSVTIPDSVTSIGDEAFEDCTLLTSITIPDSVTSIGYGAFSNCESLTSVTIPDSVTSIGNYAFYYCYSLTSVYITDIVAWCKISFGTYYSNPLSYAEYIYLNNELVTDLIIPDSVTSIGSYVFDECTSLTSITIGKGVTSIGKNAFSGCTGELIVNCNIPSASLDYYGAFYDSRFTRVTIGDSVTSIGDYAFRNCESLTSVTIADSVTSIGDDAFSICTSLTSVTIGNGVTSIGDEAFEDCTSLTSVTIGNGVTSIGWYAFNGCTSLKEVYCKPTTPPTGGHDMFYGNPSGRKIYVPSNSVSAYKSASGWGSYASAIVGYDF